MFSRGGELLTQTEDTVGQWKEHFEELLNPANTSFGEEAESEASGEAPPISLAEVAEVVIQLFSVKAPGVDEIRPEMLKALDIVGLSWLTRLCNVAWGSGTVPVVWQTGVVVPFFKKGDRSVCSNYRGITLLRLPWKVYSRVLEKEAPADWQTSNSGRAMWLQESVRFGDLRIASLLFADDVVLLATSDRDLLHALGRFAAECEAFGMRVSTSKSEAMVLCRKTVECSLRVRSELLPQAKEFKYLGVLFMSEGKMEWEMDRRIGAASAVMRALYRSIVVKKELSRKAKLSIYQSIYVP